MVEFISKSKVSSIIPEREQISHKSTFGRVVNIAGCKVYPGAAYLSSVSALKTGCGFLSLACVESIIPIVASMAPEITYIPLKSDESGCIDSNNLITNLDEYDVISIGCGLNTRPSTCDFVFDLISKISQNQKLIIDADGINIIAKNAGNICIKNAVLTPHPKELSRLLNVDINEILDNREKYARITSQTYDCITVLKGHNTIVTDGEKIFINQTGNSALAKAGTGDVLTGIISALLAQRVKPFEAAIAGVYIHGLAGDIASDDMTQYSVLASDIIDYIPFAISDILSEE